MNYEDIEDLIEEHDILVNAVRQKNPFRNISQAPAYPWKVELVYNGPNITTTVNGKGTTFEDAVKNAWATMDQNLGLTKASV